MWACPVGGVVRPSVLGFSKPQPSSLLYSGWDAPQGLIREALAVSRVPLKRKTGRKTQIMEMVVLLNDFQVWELFSPLWGNTQLLAIPIS